MSEGVGRTYVIEPIASTLDSNRGRLQNGHYDMSGSTARTLFTQFFRGFYLDSVFIYRDALLRHWSRNEHFVEVDLAHVNEFNHALYQNLANKPGEIMPFFEAGARDALEQSLTPENQEVLRHTNMSDFQVILKSAQNPQSLRNLTSEHVNLLVKVPGIVISCSKTRAKATLICLRCTKCQTVKVITRRIICGIMASF